MASVTEIRPLLLVANKNVELVVDHLATPENTGNLLGPACVEVMGGSGKTGERRYKITLYRAYTRQIFDASWLKGRVNPDEFEAGLVIHEVGHVKYGSFIKGPEVYNRNNFKLYLDNVLEDARIEYQMTLDHPTYVRYIRWALAGMKAHYNTNNITLLDEGRMDKLNQLTSTFYGFVRFGVIAKGSDPKFVSFMLPLVVSNARGTRDNTIMTVNAIYDYIQDEVKKPQPKPEPKQDENKGADGEGSQPSEQKQEDAEDEQDSPEQGEGEPKATDGETDASESPERESIEGPEQDETEEPELTDQQVNRALGSEGKDEEIPMSEEEILEAASQEQVANNGTHSIAEQAESLINGDEDEDDGDALSNGLLPGSGDTEIVIEERDEPFYRQVVNQEAVTISNLRQVFKKVFDSVNWKGSYDGELEVTRQQNAYINSITGDQGLDYQRLIRKDPGMDVVLLRDISGSTLSLETPFAKAIVVALASIEGMPKVHTAMIDFGSNFEHIKGLRDDLRTARIFPRSDGGGTNAYEALEEVSKLPLKAPTKLVFFITDGGVGNPAGCTALIEQMRKAKGIETFPLFIHDNKEDVSVMNDDCGLQGLQHITISQIPAVVSARIMERFKRHTGN